MSRFIDTCVTEDFKIGNTDENPPPKRKKYIEQQKQDKVENKQTNKHRIKGRFQGVLADIQG